MEYFQCIIITFFRHGISKTIDARVAKMKFVIALNKIDWWLWAITLALILAALLGWNQGYYMVIIISAAQIFFFWNRFKRFLAFDTQIRIAYFVFTLIGLSKTIRFPFYIFLFIGTFMVVAFNRCGIALVLKKMPWNKQPIVNIQNG